MPSNRPVCVRERLGGRARGRSRNAEHPKKCERFAASKEEGEYSWPSLSSRASLSWVVKFLACAASKRSSASSGEVCASLLGGHLDARCLQLHFKHYLAFAFHDLLLSSGVAVQRVCVCVCMWFSVQPYDWWHDVIHSSFHMSSRSLRSGVRAAARIE